MSTPHAGFHLSEERDADLAQYHALSALAVAGLVLGLLSPAALLSPMLWPLPGVAATCSVVALWWIRRNAPALIGRRLAQAGLVLALACAAAAASDWLVYRRLLRNEARRFAAKWFECLEKGDLHKAHQLVLHPGNRQALDDNLWEFYRHNANMHRSLENYLKEAPLLQTLLALGPRAQVRYYCGDGQGAGEDVEYVNLIYAISFDEPDGQQTFFARIGLERFKLDSGRAGWRIAHAEAGFRPPGW